METDVKIEKVMPVFFGILGSLVLSAFLSIREPGIPGCSAPESGNVAAEKPTPEEPGWFFTEMQEENRDLIQELYQKKETRNWVIGFFSKMCGSRDIAEAILAAADRNDISPALAFALGWEESRFNPRAVNPRNRDESIDRGLFQLNSRSFPGIEVHAFYDLEVNARYGMSHLRHCLDTGGTEIAALAMYNAGTGRVGTTGAPKSTLDYVHRILKNRQRIESHFKAQLPSNPQENRTNFRSRSPVQNVPDVREEEKYPIQADANCRTEDFPEKSSIAKPGRTRFVPLAPLTWPRRNYR